MCLYEGRVTEEKEILEREEKDRKDMEEKQIEEEIKNEIVHFGKKFVGQKFADVPDWYCSFANTMDVISAEAFRRWLKRKIY